MRDEHQTSIGNTIARLREQQGWSQRQLAQTVGLDQSAVSRIEAGRRRIAADELQRFADALRVTADTLLGQTPPETQTPPLAPATPMPPSGSESPLSAELASEMPPGPLQRALMDTGVYSYVEDRDPELMSLLREVDAQNAVSRLRADDLAESDEAGSREAGDDAGAASGDQARIYERAEFDMAEADSLIVEADVGDAGVGRTPAGQADASQVPASEADARGWTARHLSLPRFQGPQLGRAIGDSPETVPLRDRIAEESIARISLPSKPPHFQLPELVAAVTGDWFELRDTAGGDRPARLRIGHSAQGQPARLADPVQSAGSELMSGNVLYDRVARFWRSELHVDPDEGPVPDLVPLLEEGLGIQIIVARVAQGPVARAGIGPVARAGIGPVAAAFTIDSVPFVFVNAGRPVVLQRFALAHAFAHLVLGHGDKVDHRVEWSRNHPREASANDFAEEFLAPVRAVQRWYERRGDPRPGLQTMLELGNSFGISAFSAFYRSRAAGRLNPKQFAQVRKELYAIEWQVLPRQAFLGGLRDTLTHLTPDESAPPGRYGPPAVLRVPAPMRSWALAAVSRGRLSVERAAGYLRVEARELAAQLARLGLE